MSGPVERNDFHLVRIHANVCAQESLKNFQACHFLKTFQREQKGLQGHNMFYNCQLTWIININPLNPELNPICYLLTLLGAHHFLHISRIRVKLLTFRLLMSYIYMEHPFLMFLDHTQRRSTVGRTPLDE